MEKVKYSIWGCPIDSTGAWIKECDVILTKSIANKAA